MIVSDSVVETKRIELSTPALQNRPEAISQPPIPEP
jgi:hypothetical protein